MPARYHFGKTIGRLGRSARRESDDSLCSHVDDEASVDARYDGTDNEGLRAVIDELERDLAECRNEAERREKGREELESAAAERRTFPDAVHEQMRSVGSDVRSSVVSIDDPDVPGESIGTGWAIEDGLVVTAAAILAGPADETLADWTGPVPDGPDAVTVETIHGAELRVERSATGSGSPVAVVEAETEGLDPLATASADDVEEGDPLLTVGHPGGVGRWVMSLGRYAGPDGQSGFRIDGPVSHATTDLPTRVAPIAGAPVFDREGRVVGLVEGPRPRTAEPTPGTFSRADEVFQGLPDVYDLVAVDAAVVVDRVTQLQGAIGDGAAPGAGGDP